MGNVYIVYSNTVFSYDLHILVILVEFDSAWVEMVEVNKLQPVLFKE